MNKPPAHIPQQPWQYPPQHSSAMQQTPAPVGGYYTRGNNLAVPTPEHAATSIWDGKVRRRNGKAIAAFTLAGLGAIGVLIIVMIESGASSTLVGTVVALIPLAVVLITVRWLDRWEPEPRLYLFLAFAWGAGIATAFAIYFNTKAFSILIQRGVTHEGADFLATVIVAPITEEFIKGAALLAIVLWRRRLINSAVDLVVYAATIASGFAFTENILYFARGSLDGYLGVVFFGRAIMAPFSHIMFTTVTALVIATILYSSKRNLLWAYPLGTLGAIALHAAWNFTAMTAGDAFFTVFLILHVPIFIGFVCVVMILRRRERRHIITNLNEYASAGWFVPHEVTMLGSLRLRSQAQTWAKNFGVRSGESMAQFQIVATQLALTRQHIIKTYRKNPESLPMLLAEEQQFLKKISVIRTQFLSQVGPVEPLAGVRQ